MSGPGQRRPAGCTGPQAPAGARTVSFLGGKQGPAAAPAVGRGPDTRNNQHVVTTADTRPHHAAAEALLLAPPPPGPLGRSLAHTRWVQGNVQTPTAGS